MTVQQLSKRKELVDRKRQVIKDLQNDRDSVVRMLALLSIQVPPQKMWFDKLSQTGNAVTLEGVAQSNEAIVEFMRNLKSSPYIEKEVSTWFSEAICRKGNETEGVSECRIIFVQFPKFRKKLKM